MYYFKKMHELQRILVKIVHLQLS